MKNSEGQNVVRLGERTHSERVVLTPRAANIGINNTLESRATTPDSFKVMNGLFGKLLTMLLVPMIFVYPLAPAYAQEVASSTPDTSTTTTPTDSASAATSSSPTDSLTADLSSAASGAIDAVTSLFSGSSTPDNSSASGDAASSTATSSNESFGSTTSDASSTDQNGSSTPTLGDTGSTTPSTGTSTESENGSSTPEQSSGNGEGVTASSTDESTATSTSVSNDTSSSTIAAPTRTPEQIANDILQEKEDSIRASIRKEVEDEYTKGCVALDTTGYYCLKDRSAGVGALTPSVAVTDVTSLPDSSGATKQIFMTRGGEVTQLTHSIWDNAFPAMDVSGKSIVWQGNVNGRWQIFYASVGATGTPEVMQVTNSNDSNFNPKVDGDDIVWQGWVDGNWEIFLAEHLDPTSYYSTSTLPQVNSQLGIGGAWKVTRITTNTVHDMFPSVAGGLVTWQSFQDNAWNVYVYSIKAGVTQKISSGGEKSENPRFAITWDQRSDGGDARMVSYDIASGKTIDLTDEARQVNDEKTPYKQPSAPISQPDQAALPATGPVGTSTNMKSDGDGATGNGLPTS